MNDLVNNPREARPLTPPSTGALWGGLAGLLWMTMETLCFTVWYDGLAGSQAGWAIKLAFLWFTLFASHALTRRALRQGWTIRRRQAVFLGWILLTILASLRLLFFAGQPVGLFRMVGLALAGFIESQAGYHIYWHILIILLVTGRGVLMGSQTANRGNTAHSFQFGLILFLIYGLFLGSSKPLLSLALLFAYLAAGLLAMSFARIADLGAAYGGRLPGFSAERVYGILLSTAAVILLAALAGFLFNQQVANAIVQVLLALVAAFLGAMIFLLSPMLAFILEQLYQFGRRIFTSFPEFFQESAMQAAAEQSLENAEESARLFSDLVNKGLPFILGGILLAVALLVVLQLRKDRARPAFAGEEDQSESLAAKRPKFRLPFGQAPGQGAGRFRPGGVIAAARIRRTYAQLMRLCRQMGIPRRPAVTPLEFLPVMLAAFPGCEQELARITAAYQQVRYGEIPETSQAVQDVLSAWERVRQAGNTALNQHRKKTAR